MSEYHSFNVEAATKYGVACALLLEHIGYWVKRNQANGVNRRNGKYWMYKSVKDFARAYPYFTENQIRRAIEKLRFEGLIVSDHFSTGECTRTLWYTLTRNGRKLISGGGSDLASVPNRTGNEADSDGLDSRNEQATMPERLASVPNRTGNEAESSIEVLEPIVETVVETVVEDGGGSDIENPFGDATTAALFTPDPLVIYASNNLLGMNGDNMDELISFRDALPDELIRYAINEACGSGVRLYKYVKSILNRYVDQGFKTVAEVEAYDAERKKRKGGTNGGEHRRDSSGAPQRIGGETIV